MTKNKTILFCLFLLSAGVIYFFLYKDSFRSASIQIMHRSTGNRPMPVRSGRKDQPAPPVMFGFDRKFELTEVKVIPVSDILTNKYPQPIWHMVSDSNSVPVKGFAYGEKIPGMRPKVDGVLPETLHPKVPYRLFVKAGAKSGEYDFQIQSP